MKTFLLVCLAFSSASGGPAVDDAQTLAVEWTRDACELVYQAANKDVTNDLVDHLVDHRQFLTLRQSQRLIEQPPASADIEGIYLKLVQSESSQQEWDKAREYLQDIHAPLVHSRAVSSFVLALAHAGKHELAEDYLAQIRSPLIQEQTRVLLSAVKVLAGDLSLEEAQRQAHQNALAHHFGVEAYVAFHASDMRLKERATRDIADATLRLSVYKIIAIRYCESDRVDDAHRIIDLLDAAIRELDEYGQAAGWYGMTEVYVACGDIAKAREAYDMAERAVAEWAETGRDLILPRRVYALLALGEYAAALATVENETPTPSQVSAAVAIGSNFARRGAVGDVNNLAQDVSRPAEIRAAVLLGAVEGLGERE